ncbi:hypothetical protein PFISCL1PPCAC_1847, partial [Pristionchus fissidentatus]
MFPLTLNSFFLTLPVGISFSSFYSFLSLSSHREMPFPISCLLLLFLIIFVLSTDPEVDLRWAFGNGSLASCAKRFSPSY